MNRCDEIRPWLDDLVDGRLDRDRHAAVTAHLGGCEDCRAEAEALQALLAAARHLDRQTAPGRDLWPDIAARLQRRDIRPASAGAGVAGSGPVDRLRAQSGRRRLAYLPQAGLLVAACLTAVLLLSDSRPPGVATSGPLPESLLQLDASYSKVRSELRQTLDARCTDLPGETCAELEGTVEVLDESAAAVSRALREGGSTPKEALLLSSNYQMTIDRARGLMSRLSRL